MSKSPYKPRQPGSLKAAVQTVVTKAGGNGPAGELLGKSSSQVHRYTDPGEPEYHMPVNAVLMLQRASGCAAVTELLAAEMGGVVLWLPAADGGDVARDFAALGEMASKLFADYGAALAGPDSPGRVDAGEAARMVAVADRLMAALAHLRGDLKLISESGAGKGGAGEGGHG